MLRIYFIAALRSLARNKLYAGVNILGLSIGLAAALLIALFVRDELSYDRFIPQHERSYMLTYDAWVPGRSLLRGNRLPPELAAPLKLEVPGIEAVARLDVGGGMLCRADLMVTEPVYWADPDFFRIVPLPIFAGSADTALSEPNGVVLTRAVARKYFGDENVVGRTLELCNASGRHPMQVKAVLRDLPSNTHLRTEIIASGRTSFSTLAWYDTHPKPANDFSNDIWLYLKLAPGIAQENLQASLPAFLARNKQLDAQIRVALQAVPLTDIHLHPAVYGAMKPPGSLEAVYGLSVVGLLIVVVAVANFINLSITQFASRITEIGVRKAVGAARRDVAVQLISESLLHVALASVLALALVELSLPVFNTALDRTLSIWNDPWLIGAIPILVVAIGIAAGLYPAALLSAVRPLDAMNNRMGRSGGSTQLRQTTVVLQFSVLIGLVLATLVIYRQTLFATTAAVRLDTDQVLLIRHARCEGAFKERLQTLPGITGVACSRDWPMNNDQSNNFAILPNGEKVLVERIVVDAGLLELYGLQPLVGRFFSSARATDVLGKDQTTMQASLVLNETAVRRLGFASAEAAVGKLVTINDVRSRAYPSEIIGVVADFPRDSIRGTVSPSVFFVEPAEFNLLNVKLAGRDIPETLAAIDKLWKMTEGKPIVRLLLNQYIDEQYSDMRRNTALLTGFAAIALSVASLGLFGLSAFVAERRTKEIGVRKALGASTREVMGLLIWQFTKPVLWANLIAWPVAGFLMYRWLHGFAYRIDLEPWLFVASSGAALLIALLTVSTHCYLVARAKPVAALRYE